MTTKQAKLFFATLGLSATLLAGGARAETLTYDFYVDTSSLAGTTGYLDFQFNPGDTPYDAGSATLSNFVSDGTLTGSDAAPFGDVSGTLQAGPVVIDDLNNSGLNEYTPGFTFGSYFAVAVSLEVPVSGLATGGNIFSLDVEDSNFNSLLGGFPAITINLDATTGNPSVVNNAGNAADVTATPEPGTWMLLLTGISGVALIRRRKSASAVC
jgi:hypothetical protein